MKFDSRKSTECSTDNWHGSVSYWNRYWAYGRHSSPIFEFWKNGLFICSIDRVLIADLRNI